MESPSFRAGMARAYVSAAMPHFSASVQRYCTAWRKTKNPIQETIFIYTVVE